MAAKYLSWKCNFEKIRLETVYPYVNVLLQTLTSVWNAAMIVTVMPSVPTLLEATHANATLDTKATELTA